jgi:hypothetical protein
MLILVLVSWLSVLESCNETVEVETVHPLGKSSRNST